MSAKRAPVQLPDFLQPSGTEPHTGDVVPDPAAVATQAPRSRRPAPVRQAVAPAQKTGVPVEALEASDIAALRRGAVTRVDVQVPVGISTWLRDSTRPQYTSLPRSLGARTPASSLLTAAVELLAERGMDLSRLSSSEPDAVTAAFRAALEAAAKPS